MLNDGYIITGIFLDFLAGLIYLLATLRGQIRPNKVTWLTWGSITMVAFIAQTYQSVGLSSFLTFIAGFMPLVIFLASFFNKNAYWRISKLDMVCGALAFIGIILWQVTEIPNLAILFVIFANIAGAIPTVIKSYTDPSSEKWLPFFLSTLGALVVLLATNVWDFATAAFPIYHFISSLLLFTLIKFDLGRKNRE